MKNCSACEHWEDKQLSADAERMGRCTGNIPAAAVIQGRDFAGQPAINVITYWPETHGNDRCGGWKQKDSSTLLQTN